MKTIIILIATVITVSADISHLLNKFRPSNAYLPPQRQPHSEYGAPSLGAQNYYSNIPESFVRIDNSGSGLQQSIYTQPSGQGFVPQYRPRPVQVQTIYVKEQTYRPQPPLIHQPAPLARPIPVYQPSIQPIYRPPPQVIQPPIRQPAPFYQAAPAQQTIIQQYPVFQPPIQQAPIQQVPIQQAPIEQAPIQQVPIQQYPSQQYPIQQAPIQPSNEYLPPLASPAFALPSAEPAPSFHSGSTVSLLPSISSTFIPSKTSFDVSSIGSSAPSSEYLPPVQQTVFQQPSISSSGSGFGFSSGGQGSFVTQEPAPAHTLDSNGYTYRRP